MSLYLGMKEESWEEQVKVKTFWRIFIYDTSKGLVQARLLYYIWIHRTDWKLKKKSSKVIFFIII